MAAKDYVFNSDENGIYLTKQLKDPQAISKDKREVTEKEIVSLFGVFFTRYCQKNSVDAINITINGKPIYTAKLCGQEATDE